MSRYQNTPQIRLRRGPQWKKIKRTTVICHLYPTRDLPPDIRKIVVDSMGTAHLNSELNVVEVGGTRKGEYEDMWFWYRLVKNRTIKGGSFGYKGVLEDTSLRSGWRERMMGNVSHMPCMRHYTTPNEQARTY